MGCCCRPGPGIKNAMAPPSNSSASTPPCAACKLLRRKCMPGCIFAPYFPPDEPQKFASVHKIFGASNISKLLNDLLPHQREDAVNSLAYEAEARMKDPVYGCVGAISVLQRQVQLLQSELEAANARLLQYTCSEIRSADGSTPSPQFVSGNGDGDDGGFYCHPSGLPVPFHAPVWNHVTDHYYSGGMNGTEGGERRM